VDSQGGLLLVYVSAADVNDRTALSFMAPLIKAQHATVQKIWADMGYQSKKLTEELADYCIELDIVKRPHKEFYLLPEVGNVVAYLKERGIELYQGFKVLPKRWIVERTFAWLGKYRRLSKDYELLCHTQETMIKLGMVRTLVKRAVNIRLNAI
jgi:putative transposase